MDWENFPTEYFEDEIDDFTGKTSALPELTTLPQGPEGTDPEAVSGEQEPGQSEQDRVSGEEAPQYYQPPEVPYTPPTPQPVYQPNYYQPIQQDYRNWRQPTNEDVQDINTYTRYVVGEANRAFEQRLAERQANERVVSSEQAAREKYSDYDSMIDRYVVPLIHARPEVFELLRSFPSPAEAAYTLSFVAANPNFAQTVKSQGVRAAFESLPQTAFRPTVRGRNHGRMPSGRLSKAEIDSMPIPDFEAELERFKNSGEGERPSY